MAIEHLHVELAMTKSLNEFQLNLTSASKKLKNLPALKSLDPNVYRYRLNPEISVNIITQCLANRALEFRMVEGAQNLLRISVDESFQELYALLYSWTASRLKKDPNCLPIISRRWSLADNGTKFSYMVFLLPGEVKIKHSSRAPMANKWIENEVSYDINDVEIDLLKLDPLLRLMYFESCRKFIINCADTKFAEDAITKAMNKILKKI